MHSFHLLLVTGGVFVSTGFLSAYLTMRAESSPHNLVQVLGPETVAVAVMVPVLALVALAFPTEARMFYVAAAVTGLVVFAALTRGDARRRDRTAPRG